MPFTGGGGGSGGWMTEVGSDCAVAWPFWFVAVTAERTVCPTSSACRVYLLPVAPAIVAQLPPDVSHSFQA